MWKIEPSTLNPKTVARRLRLVAHLRNVCLSLAKAKRTGEVRPLSTRKLSREEENAILAQLDREAAEDGKHP